MRIAVIFAGGVGSRMHSKDTPKQFLKLHDKPIIVHTLELFDAIVVACVANYIGYMSELVRKYNLNKVQKIVPGGKSGQESIYNDDSLWA